ncbi:MAG TPA: adenosylcobinamide-GDP ribazoletransferase [Peptococcaceae bacterium]|nr:adenosylcobinamide-GDP ribazoletransferase [Peptococcaceae bacterium]
MKDFLSAIVIAFSFLTAIPLPMLEWKEQRIKFLPVLMPLVGLGIGSLGYCLFCLLDNFAFSVFSKAVIMALFYPFITGGLHLDGLMDTADAYFSRQSIEQKLKIMKDSRVGAFAVITLISLLLLKVAFFSELFLAGRERAYLLLFIPVSSRIVQAVMLCSFPYAKEDGLAVMFGKNQRKGVIYTLSLFLAITAGFIYLLDGFYSLLLPLGLILFTGFYYFFARKNFGGITGDIVGAYVELAELLLLGILVTILQIEV